MADKNPPLAPGVPPLAPGVPPPGVPLVPVVDPLAQFGPFLTADLPKFDPHGDQIRLTYELEGDLYGQSYVFPIKFAITSGAVSYTDPKSPGSVIFTTPSLSFVKYPHGGTVTIGNGRLFAHKVLKVENPATIKIPCGGYVKFFDNDSVFSDTDEDEDEIDDAVPPQFGPFPPADPHDFDFQGDQIRLTYLLRGESYVFPIKFAVTSGAVSYSVPESPDEIHFTTAGQLVNFPHGGMVRIGNGVLFAHEPMEVEDKDKCFICIPSGGYAKCFNNEVSGDGGGGGDGDDIEVEIDDDDAPSPAAAAVAIPVPRPVEYEVEYDFEYEVEYN